MYSFLKEQFCTVHVASEHCLNNLADCTEAAEKSLCEL